MDEKEKGQKSKSLRAKSNKTCNIIMNERVHIVFDMIMDGMPTPEIRQWVMNEWGVSNTQSYNYLRKAKDLRKGISRALAVGKYEEQQKKVLEELWLLYETEATTVKEKRELLVSFDKIAKGEKDIDESKNHKWTNDKTDADLLKLVGGEKLDEEKK